MFRIRPGLWIAHGANGTPSLLATSLLLIASLSTTPCLAAEPNQTGGYRFFPCETMVRVKLLGLPEVAGEPLKDSIDSCGTGMATRIDPPDPIYYNLEGSDPIWEQLPILSVEMNRGRFDVVVRWNASAAPITYTATQLAAATAETILTPDRPGGPRLRVSLEPTGGNSYVGINADGTDAKRILEDLERKKGLTFQNKSLIAGHGLTFPFDALHIQGLIGLLADQSWLNVRRDGASTYVFGEPANAKTIRQLRTELEALSNSKNDDQRIKLLQDIINLAPTDKPHELPSIVVPELEELATLLVEREEYARAKELILMQIEQIEANFLGEPSAEQGIALVDLGRILRLENDLEAATTILENALTMLDENPDDQADPARVSVFLEQAYVAMELGNLETASTVIQLAYAVLNDKRMATWDMSQISRALEPVESLARSIAIRYLENGNRAASQIHIEAALWLGVWNRGRQDPSTDTFRYLAGLNLTELGDKARASRFLSEQVDVSRSRDKPLSRTYLRAVVLFCTNLVEQEQFAVAQELWEQHVSLIRSAAGESSVYYVLALKDLALLHRLSLDADKASDIERKISSIVIEPMDTKNQSSLPEDVSKLLKLRVLADNLLIHYFSLAKEIEKSIEIDYAAGFLAIWRGIEVMVSTGQTSSAITALHDLEIAALKHLPERSIEPRRYAERRSELCEIYNQENDLVDLPRYACTD